MCVCVYTHTHLILRSDIIISVRNQLYYISSLYIIYYISGGGAAWRDIYTHTNTHTHKHTLTHTCARMPPRGLEHYYGSPCWVCHRYVLGISHANDYLTIVCVSVSTSVSASVSVSVSCLCLSAMMMYVFIYLCMCIVFIYLCMYIYVYTYTFRAYCVFVYVCRYI